MRFAVLGLGEAGSIYAGDLVERGASVTGADPFVTSAPTGVTLAPSIADAVRDAEVVLSLVGSKAAASVLAEALPAMQSTAVFGDMNTGGPEQKRELAARAAELGIRFVDVAVIAPVPRARIDTPLLLSGSGAAALQPLLEQIRIPATVVGPEAGVAAGLKMVRSVFMKGLAALVFESAEAGAQIGAQEWITDQIAGELGPGGQALVQRLIDGTRQHAARRETEMVDAQAFLESLGAAHPMTDATLEWLRALAAR